MNTLQNISRFINFENIYMQTEDFYARFVPVLPVIIHQSTILLTQNICYHIIPLCTLISLVKTYISRSFKLCSVTNSVSPCTFAFHCPFPLNILALLC